MVSFMLRPLYSRGKIPRYPLWLGPRAGLVPVVTNKLPAHAGIQTQSCNLYPVTILTELFRFIQCIPILYFIFFGKKTHSIISVQNFGSRNLMLNEVKHGQKETKISTEVQLLK